jgi:hypothetical protein
VSCKHAGITGAMFASPSTFVCSFCEADSLRAQLATVTAERDRLLIENHRLRELVQVVDVNHVRVRDGLRRACDGWQDDVKRSRGIPAQLEQESITEIAELRKLVT